MTDAPPNLTLQRILDAAEAQFSERGYVPVRLRDIAAAIGAKHTVLYYYLPGGKEQLYVDVMTRSLQRHRLGMEAAIAQAGPDLRRQMQAVAAWLLSQPPLNLARMEASDFPAIAGITIVLGIVYLVVNTVVELVQAALDPRLRL